MGCSRQSTQCGVRHPSPRLRSPRGIPPTRFPLLAWGGTRRPDALVRPCALNASGTTRSTLSVFKTVCHSEPCEESLVWINEIPRTARNDKCRAPPQAVMTQRTIPYFRPSAFPRSGLSRLARSAKISSTLILSLEFPVVSTNRKLRRWAFDVARSRRQPRRALTPYPAGCWRGLPRSC